MQLDCPISVSFRRAQKLQVTVVGQVQFCKTMRNAWNSYAKNNSKCVKFICKKQCEMREINMQKTVRNASNSYAKNSAKRVKFICKKQCEMRQIHMQKTVRNAWNSYVKTVRNAKGISRCFLHRNLAHFQRFFFQENLQKNVWLFSTFFKLFHDVFYGTVCRDGKGGIPVKSRCKCGNPGRDCTEKTRFGSAKSTKSEIGAKVGKCR